MPYRKKVKEHFSMSFSGEEQMDSDLIAHMENKSKRWNKRTEFQIKPP